MSSPGAAAPAAPSDALPQYRAAINKPAFRCSDVFSHSATAACVNALTRIVEAEGPIVEELALRRFADWAGVERLTDRYRNRVRKLLDMAANQHEITIAGHVLWPADLDPRAYEGFRLPGCNASDQREIEHVPLIERTNAVVFVVHEQLSLPIDDLVRSALTLLGVQRMTPRAKSLMMEAVDGATASGRLKVVDGSVTSGG